MVVDTSVLVAILRSERDADELSRKLFDGFPRRLSAASYLELSMVMSSGGGADGLLRVDAFLEKAEIEIVPVTEQDALLAREAFLHFGKGRHPAGLNFGDCFSYALAKRLGEPLLFKGNDFTQTDLEPV
jgi:ribonuclease VapC